MPSQIRIDSKNIEDEIARLNAQGYTVDSSKPVDKEKALMDLFYRKSVNPQEYVKDFKNMPKFKIETDDQKITISFFAIFKKKDDHKIPPNAIYSK